jgi:Peptidase inhibitor family I36
MIRRLVTLLAGMLAMGALLATPAGASAPKVYGAQAGDTPISIMAWSDCPANRMCIFNNLNGGRGYGYFATGDGDLADSSGPTGLNNNTESVWNRTSQDWCFYDAGGYHTLIFVVGPAFQGNLDPVDRNKVTSLRICP